MSSAKEHREKIWELQAKAFDVVSSGLTRRLMEYSSEEQELMNVTSELPKIIDELRKEEKCILQCSHWFQRETLYNQAEKTIKGINETLLRKLADLRQLRLEARVLYLEERMQKCRIDSCKCGSTEVKL